MTSDLLLNSRVWDEFTIYVNIAFFACPFSFRNVPTNAFPLIFPSVLAYAPDLKLALIL